MRGGLLVDLTPSAGAHGERGIGRYVRGLASAIATMDPAVGNVITGMVTRGQAERVPLARKVIAQSFESWRPQDFGWFVGAVTVAVALRASGSSLFHATDPRKAWIPPTARRTLVTAYDLIPLTDPDIRRGLRAHRRAIFDLYLRSLQRATRVVAISGTTSAEIQERLGIPAERIDVVYPVIIVHRQVRGHDTPTEPAFLFVGVPDRHKRPELAIDALASYRRDQHCGTLRFIGPASADRRRELIGRASKRGVAGYVQFVGRISDSELSAAYASSTALLAVSKHEGFGLPPAEAALHGLAVIAVDTPVARETLGAAATYADADADALAAVMADPTQPADTVLADLRGRYSIEAVALALARAYRKLLDEGIASP